MGTPEPSLALRERGECTREHCCWAGPVAALAWSPNGQLLAAASQDAPGFMVFDVSLGLGTPVQAGERRWPGPHPMQSFFPPVPVNRLHAILDLKQ